MTAEKRNRILSIGALVLAFYLLLSEVCPRYKSTVDLYLQVRDREQSLITSEEFHLKKSMLQTERRQLDNLAKQKYAFPGAGESGIFGYLNATAGKEGFIIESFAPLEGRTTVSSGDFTLRLALPFHEAAKYINEIETGPIPITLTNLTFQSELPGDHILKVSITGHAQLIRNTK